MIFQEWNLRNDLARVFTRRATQGRQGWRDTKAKVGAQREDSRGLKLARSPCHQHWLLPFAMPFSPSPDTVFINAILKALSWSVARQPTELKNRTDPTQAGSLSSQMRPVPQAHWALLPRPAPSRSTLFSPPAQAAAQPPGKGSSPSSPGQGPLEHLIFAPVLICRVTSMVTFYFTALFVSRSVSLFGLSHSGAGNSFHLPLYPSGRCLQL